MKRLLAIVLGLVCVAPTWAKAAQMHLAIGVPPGGVLAAPTAMPAMMPQDGMRLDLGLSRDFAFGPVVQPGGTPLTLGDGHLALGAFVEYPLDAFRFGASVSESALSHRAELSAGYEGGDTALRIRLGTEWGDGESYFSPNPALAGYGYQAPDREYDLSLTLRHRVTPGVVVSGLAAASRSGEPEAAGDDTFLFGASIGLRF